MIVRWNVIVLIVDHAENPFSRLHIYTFCTHIDNMTTFDSLRLLARIGEIWRSNDSTAPRVRRISTAEDFQCVPQRGAPCGTFGQRHH